MSSLKYHTLPRTLQCTDYLVVSNNRRWCSRLDGTPGFTDQVFEFLKKEVQEGRNVIGSITLDEMSIKKHLFFDWKKYQGVVDLGDEREVGDDEKLASDALVFMLVAVNSFWKVPLGYFFINGLDSAGKFFKAKNI